MSVDFYSGLSLTTVTSCEPHLFIALLGRVIRLSRVKVNLNTVDLVRYVIPINLLVLLLLVRPGRLASDVCGSL